MTRVGSRRENRIRTGHTRIIPSGCVSHLSGLLYIQLTFERNGETRTVFAVVVIAPCQTVSPPPFLISGPERVYRALRAIATHCDRSYSTARCTHRGLSLYKRYVDVFFCSHTDGNRSPLCISFPLRRFVAREPVRRTVAALRDLRSFLHV